LFSASEKRAGHENAEPSGVGKALRFRGTWVVEDLAAGAIERRWCTELRCNSVLAIVDAVEAIEAFNKAVTK